MLIRFSVEASTSKTEIRGISFTSKRPEVVDVPIISDIEEVVEQELHVVAPEPTKYQHLSNACDKYAANPASCKKIMEGVFVADSSFCTKGQGARNNNCGNMRPGSGKYGDSDISWTVYNNFRVYATLEDGIMDNVALYAQLYEGLDIRTMANKWAEGSNNWYRTVNQYAHN